MSDGHEAHTMKIGVGVNAKVGDANYGSHGASVYYEVEGVDAEKRQAVTHLLMQAAKLVIKEELASGVPRATPAAPPAVAAPAAAPLGSPNESPSAGTGLAEGHLVPKCPTCGADMVPHESKPEYADDFFWACPVSRDHGTMKQGTKGGPLCSKCGMTMKLRTSQRGAFYGCNSYKGKEDKGCGTTIDLEDSDQAPTKARVPDEPKPSDELQFDGQPLADDDIPF